MYFSQILSITINYFKTTNPREREREKEINNFYKNKNFRYKIILKLKCIKYIIIAEK